MVYKLEHRTNIKVSSGTNAPLGATLTPEGANFAIFSKYGREVFLLLFDLQSDQPSDIIKLEQCTENVWHIFVPGVKAGQLYGYRINGDYDPAQGKRFNPHKLLIDPYAKALSSQCKNTADLIFAYSLGSTQKDLSFDERDDAHVVPKAIVINDSFDWQNDRKPEIPIEKLIIYEVQVKGFTAHSSARVKHPGTYLGFIEKIPYLQELGVNAVELMPVQEFYIQDYLLNKGLTDFWGYNTIGFFAPESSYGTQASPGCQVSEFKTLVRELHKAGIEVIMDVVYNHTGEGSELGPTLSFKGIDNPTYYLLGQNTPEEPYRYCRNDTGCGNTLNVENPTVLKLVLDSLRYWAEFMHIDGFRFDLASILARVKGEFNHDSAFFEAISRDPVLSKVKMIAEPWDLTTYQVGNFPKGWSEWNGKFRDTVRKFLKGDEGQIKDLAARITGSADLYQEDGRKPYNSINFITCHDGFTLKDLFSYNSKHNEANLENNQDGNNDNSSWNCGFEGETTDPDIIALRKKLIKNAFCCLLFSSGIPMILYGDEVLRTQKGNNNAYCQDNEITWFNWDLVTQNEDVLEFCRKALAFRKQYTILERKRFFTGKDNDNDKVPDISWFGENLAPPVWEEPKTKFLCYQLDGSESAFPSGDYHLFFIVNAGHQAHSVQLPQHQGFRWHRVIDTSLKSGDDFLPEGKELSDNTYSCDSRSTVVLLGRAS